MSMGYENAPIIQVVSAFTILLGWFHGSSNISSLDLFKLGKGEFWRLLLSQLIFENTAETVVGLMLLYIFRQFERQMGTRKFGFFVFMSFVISVFNLITFEILLLGVDIIFVPASGPYFLIFSMLSIFYCKSPVLILIKKQINENGVGLKMNLCCVSSAVLYLQPFITTISLNLNPTSFSNCSTIYHQQLECQD